MSDVDQSGASILDAAEIASLDALGTRRPVAAGEYLYREGDPAYDFYVVLSGLVEIFVTADGEERIIARRGPGHFLGELNLLSGLRVFLSARVAEPGEVLAVPASSLRRVLATQPGLSDKILAAFMARRRDLLTGAATAVRVVGSRYSPRSLQVRDFLARLRVPHEWLEAEADPQVQGMLTEFSVQPSELPVVIVAGSVMRRATPQSVADYLGLTVGRPPGRVFDLVVIGAGPAGLAAAVYAASEGLGTLGVDAVAPGGQAGDSTRIENYFGFPRGISGGELIHRGLIQAEKFGAQLSAPLAATGLREEAGHLVVSLSDGTAVTGRAVLVATGARYRRLAAERLDEFEGRGVYYAATDLEARQYGGSPVIVVGGGNSAGQAALFLADHESDVTVVIRGPDLAAGMSRYLVDRVDSHPRIAVRAQTTVVALGGEATLREVTIAGPDGNSALRCDALFSFIGAEPASGWLSG
jgi:thioredoxin reductase (NADPH)